MEEMESGGENARTVYDVWRRGRSSLWRGISSYDRRNVEVFQAENGLRRKRLEERLYGKKCGERSVSFGER